MLNLVALLASGLLSPPAQVALAAPSFAHEVVPILTKQGCSQGSCHGKGAGQNGFKLSLRGYAAEQDHAWLTREFDGRRLDFAHPERSLLLLKATGEVSHEGGKLFGRESREYRTLLNWVKAGAPGPYKGEAKVSKLELTPNAKVLKPGDREQLTAWATFADGKRRDVTWLTQLETNDAAVMTVARGAEARAARPGATAVRAAYLTEVAVAAFTVPHERNLDAKLFDVPANLVDTPLFTQLKALQVPPSDLCRDDEFIRRAFLDTCGLLPTPDEVTAFLADTRADKRDRLVDALLARPEFVDYWTLFLGDLLQNRKERDHDVRGVKGVRQFHAYLRGQVAQNRPWDALAREVLTASGDATKSPAVGYYVVTVGEFGEPEKSEVGESVAQAFLGTRIGCAKCHNHPLERYTQDDFYHFAAFFSRVKLDRKEPKAGVTVLKVGHRDGNQDKQPVGTRQPRTNEFLKPQPLDRSTPDIKPGSDPRQHLAAWITDPSNEFFAGAMVNRVWRHYMGVGLVEPVDDLRGTNPPTNPALWKALCADFVAHKYDLKRLMRVILTSRSYQLSSATKPENAADAKFYSHYYARRLGAEVLLDAVCDVTGTVETFDGYAVGTRALQVPDPGANSAFLKLFGRSQRTTACACERTGDVTLSQLLHLQNNQNLAGKALTKDSWLAKRLLDTSDDAKLIDQIFLRSFSRHPTTAEVDTIKGLLADGQPRAEVYADLMWAVLNAKDFAFNH